MIPRVLHQTWKDHEVPERFRAAQASWREAHPGWEYRFWTDDDLADVVERHAPELVELWRGYPDAIQRVDAARYVILREFGGAYVDLDVTCRRPVDDLLHHRLVLPSTTPFGVSNQFMLAEPGHDFFDHVLAGLPAAYRRWRFFWPRHVRILKTAGPLFLTARLEEYGEPD